MSGKSIFKCSLALTMFLSLAGCGGSGSSNNSSSTTSAAASATGTAEAASETSNDSSGKKIGILVPATTEFFANVNDKSQKAWEDAGYEVTVSSFNQDTQKQIEMIENYVSSGVSMICTNPGSNAGDDALKDAMDKGVKVFVYGVETSDYDLCAVEDEATVGKNIGTMAADFVNDKLGGKVKAVALIDTAGQDLAYRSNGLMDAFKEQCPNSEIVGTAECVNTGDGTNAMEDFLQRYPDIQVVIAYNDVFGLEAMQAMIAAGKDGDDYGVFGCDSSSEALKDIHDGTIYRGTISFGDIGQDVANYGLQLMNGDYDGQSHVKVYLNNYMVTADNIDDYYTE